MTLLMFLLYLAVAFFAAAVILAFILYYQCRENEGLRSQGRLDRLNIQLLRAQLPKDEPATFYEPFEEDD
jgi:hypothetical protein